MNRHPDPFKRIGFDAIDLSPTVIDDDGQARDVSLRMLVVSDLETLMCEAVQLAISSSSQGNRENREFFEFCRQMLTFLGACAKIDPTNDRRFDAQSFNHSPDFQEMLRMTKSRHLPQSERLKRFVTSDDRFDANSFEEARFETPGIQLPLDQIRYQTFRDNLLDEMIGVRAELENSADETVRKEARGWLRDPNESEDRKARAREILDSKDVFDVCPGLQEAWDEIEQMLMKTALQIEAQRTEPFEHLIASVDEVLHTVTALAVAENRPGEGLVEVCDDQLQRFLNVSTAAKLVRQILKVEAKYPDSMGRRAQELMTEAARGEDPLELWGALTWFRENMVNRNECIRLLGREAEWVLHLLVEMALTERFLRIRHELSRAERRLFHFMYRRSPWFNDRIPALDEIGKGFLFGLDDEHLSLVLGVACYHGTPNQTREIETRWKAFVRLYPFWIEILRSHDREQKRRTKSDPMTPEIEESFLSEDPRERIHMHLPRELVDASVDSVQDLAARYCTPKQRPVIVACFVDRRSQEELAAEFGVSQQAISKTIERGITRIREGLLSDHKLLTTEQSGWST